MNEADSVSIKQSVGTRLFRTVFPLYLLIAIAVTFVHMVLEFYNTKRSIEQELVTVASALRPGLVTALWNINFKQISAIVEGVARMPIVTGISVEDENGTVIISTGKVEGFRYSEPLFFVKNGRNYPLGRLMLYTGPKVVVHRVRLNFFLIVLNSLIKSFALLVLFIIFSRIMISRPLQELTALIRNTNIGNLASGDGDDPPPKENDELELLRKAFKGMLGNLAQAHEQLKSYSSDLEKEVAERTDALANREEHLRMANEALQQARDDVLTILEEKRQFIADISHELRTPIAVAKLQLEAMEQGVSDEVTGRETLQRKIEQMERLIGDLYTLSKTDISQLSLKFETFDLMLLLDELVDAYQQLAARKEIALSLCKSGDEEPLVSADWERLSQVFSNLLDNSLNYTNEGGCIRVEVRTVADQVEAVVADSAPGVSDDELPKLTRRLYRVDASRSRSTGGSGLGLAICRSIVMAHGGELNLAHSSLGGVQATVILPLRKREETEP